MILEAKKPTTEDIRRMPREDLIALIPAGVKSVLDAGCCRGATMAALHHKGYDVAGLDIEDTRVGEAKKLPFYEQSLNPTEGNYIGIIGRQFDCVIAGDVIEHLQNTKQGLDNLRAMLYPGGHLIASVPNSGWMGFVHQLFMQDFTYVDAGHFDRTHLRFFCLKNIRAAIEEAGFVVKSITAIRLPNALMWPDDISKDRMIEIAYGNMKMAVSFLQLEELNAYQWAVVAQKESK